MKTPKIKPLGDKILLKIERADLGSLNTEGIKTGVEWGVVVGVGPEVKTVSIGDKLFVKAWATDTIHYEGQDYYFTSEELKGICAVVQ